MSWVRPSPTIAFMYSCGIVDSFLSYNLGVKCICLLHKIPKYVYKVSALLYTPTVLLVLFLRLSHLYSLKFRVDHQGKTPCLFNTILCVSFYSWSRVFAKQWQSLMCCVGYGKHLGQTLLCSHGHSPAACGRPSDALYWLMQLRASAQILGSRTEACWGSWPSCKVPFLSTWLCPFDNTTCGTGGRAEDGMLG